MSSVGPGSPSPAVPHPPPLLSFVLVAAVLGLLADPSVAFTSTTLGQMLGMAVAIALIVGIYDGLASRSIARATGLAPRYRLYPIAIAVAFACLALSRVFDVAPGVLYGLFAGVIFAGAVDMKLQGRAYARSSLALIAAALAAYGVHRLVAGAAAGTSPGLIVIVIDTAAAALFIGGLQAVIVQLLPTRYVNGEKIASWNRLAWFALLAGSLAHLPPVRRAPQRRPADVGQPLVRRRFRVLRPRLLDLVHDRSSAPVAVGRQRRDAADGRGRGLTPVARPVRASAASRQSD